MSHNNSNNNGGNNNGGKNSRENRKKRAVRALALFLVALMLLGSFAVVIQSLGIGSFAASSASDVIVSENTSGTSASEQTQTTMQGQTPDLTQFPEMTQEPEVRTGTEPVRIGLMYGSGVTVGFEVRADHGMNFGTVIDDRFTSLWQTEKTLVSATSDANLSKSGMTYSITSSNTPVVGHWHIECEIPLENPEQSYQNVAAVMHSFGYYSFPAYINGRMVIRVGSFGTEREAQSVLAALDKVLGTMLEMKVAGPSVSGVSVIDPNTDVILFEYDDPTSELGITAIQSGDTETYLVTPAKNMYQGIFEFSRWRDGSVDGVALTNILSVEDYVAGVLPYEISNTWPEEVQKAFAVTVRTFTLSMLGRHDSAYGFDMCNSTHCQAYMGCRRANETVRKAVSDTSGMVLTYDGELCRTYYSAVVGGVTVGIKDAWGGNVDYPYLTAVPNPWEDYAGHKNGAWTAEVTPTQLLNTLVSKGYDLRGSIASVRINSFGENSSYVNSITFTDTYGKSITINTADKIRTTLSAYLNSANFVVGRGGQTVEVNNYTLATPTPLLPPNTEADTESGETDSADILPIPNTGLDSLAGESSSVDVMTADGLVEFTPGESITYAKNIGSETTVDLSKLTVITADGTKSYDMTADYSEGYTAINGQLSSIAASPSPSQAPTELPSLKNILQYQTIVVPEKITLPGSSSNFVFVGRGWGHGVGMSQWGAMNLAQLGYDCESILLAYFPGTTISNYESLPVDEG